MHICTLHNTVCTQELRVHILLCLVLTQHALCLVLTLHMSYTTCTLYCNVYTKGMGIAPSPPSPRRDSGAAGTGSRRTSLSTAGSYSLHYHNVPFLRAVVLRVQTSSAINSICDAMHHHLCKIAQRHNSVSAITYTHLLCTVIALHIYWYSTTY
jgi:hypothetical protein